jgi:hypothetical protein
LAGGVAFKFFDTKRKEGIADVLRYIVLLLQSEANLDYEHIKSHVGQ